MLHLRSMHPHLLAKLKAEPNKFCIAMTNKQKSVTNVDILKIIHACPRGRISWDWERELQRWGVTWGCHLPQPFGWWLVACWFILRKKYYYIGVDCWFILREKYCWLVNQTNKARTRNMCMKQSVQMRCHQEGNQASEWLQQCPHPLPQPQNKEAMWHYSVSSSTLKPIYKMWLLPSHTPFSRFLSSPHFNSNRLSPPSIVSAPSTHLRLSPLHHLAQGPAWKPSRHRGRRGSRHGGECRCFRLATY
jgi:hypothetical protein